MNLEALADCHNIACPDQYKGVARYIRTEGGQSWRCPICGYLCWERLG
jgi:rubrerythrin